MKKILIGIFIICVIIIIYLKNKTSNLKKEDEKLKLMREVAFSKIKQSDTYFNEANFLNWTKNQFLKLQIFYSDKEIEKLKKIETKVLFEKHKKEIEELIENKKNVISSKIVINDAKLYSYNQENGNDILTVFLKTSMLNYIEDIETSQIVEGSKLKRKDKYFLITFIRPKYETINGKIVVKCKGCGAPNTILENGKCEYCATNIATGDYDWLIEDIKNFEM